MTPSLSSLLDAIEARVKAATHSIKDVIRFDNDSGEIDYQVAGGKPYVVFCQFGDFDNPKAKADAHLFAHAHTDLGRLCEALRVAINQRDGFMVNYHVATNVNLADQREIKKDADEKIAKILSGEKV